MNENEFFDALHARVPRVIMTISLIALCCVAYVVEVVAAHSLWTIPSAVLVPLGANFAPAVQAGEWWRLPASLFLHGSPLHLGLNMLALWQLGQLAERLYGRAGFTAIYLVAGLMGCLASIWWKAGAVSIGASGAIFGECGALLGYVIVQRGAMPMTLFRDLRSGVLAFIAYSLIAGFAIPGIDNAAHIGGLFGGVVMGAGLARPVNESVRSMWRHIQVWLALAVCVAVGWGLWQAAPQVAKVYQERLAFEQIMRGFSLQEPVLEQRLQATLDSLRSRQMSAQQAASELNDNLVPLWEQQIRLLTTQAVGPEDFARRQLLVAYASSRRDVVRLLAQGIATGQSKWLEAATNLRLQGDKLLLQLRLQDARKNPQ